MWEVRVGLGKDERENKKRHPGKSRKEENLEKMGPNGCLGKPENGDMRRFSAFNIKMC